MPTHWGATGGLVLGTVLYLKDLWNHRHDAEAFKRHAVLGVIGYNVTSEEWEPWKARFSIPVLIGGGATYVAIKTGYNDWTPTGYNV